jgi:phosphatidylethanolamine/phosphatidyl-N-methylethanolamine N-methyltransferase
MGGVLTEYRLFLQEFVRRYHTTGAVLPSGRALAASLCRHVGQGSAPQRILEVGPGTGAVTSTLIQRLRPQDRLCLIEVNDAFVACLRDALHTKPAFRAVADRVELVHGRVEDLPESAMYDVIVSGLPLNNFAVEDVRSILTRFSRLLRPGGVLSFFEYIAIRSVKATVSGRADRERLRAIGKVMSETLTGREFKRDWVWPNVPPAWVHHVRFYEPIALPPIGESVNSSMSKTRPE